MLDGSQAYRNTHITLFHERIKRGRVRRVPCGVCCAHTFNGNARRQCSSRSIVRARVYRQSRPANNRHSLPERRSFVHRSRREYADEQTRSRSGAGHRAPLHIMHAASICIHYVASLLAAALFHARHWLWGSCSLLRPFLRSQNAMLV